MRKADYTQVLVAKGKYSLADLKSYSAKKVKHLYNIEMNIGVERLAEEFILRDSRGNVAREEFESDKEMEEPFDVEYLSNEPYEVEDLSGEEKRFYKKLHILERRLKKAGIRGACEWMPQHEMFRVRKMVGEYPTYMYLAIYDCKEYGFGTWDDDAIVSTDVKEVVAEVVEWLNKKVFA